MQILVLGMHRSGTSALSRILNLMGAYFGPEGHSTGVSAENPKGFWERRDVRKINDALLHALGCDWDRVASFSTDALPPAAKERFLKDAAYIVHAMDGHRPWFIKEPRLCVLLPLWRKVLEVPIFVHVHRDPVEVAMSLEARNGIPRDVGSALWERYERDASFYSSGVPTLHVSHHGLMEAPVAHAEQLLAELEALGVSGLRMPHPRELQAFIDPALYRQRAAAEPGMRGADDAASHLFRKLLAGDRSDHPGCLASGSHRVLRAYESSLSLAAEVSAASTRAIQDDTIVPVGETVGAGVVAGLQNRQNQSELQSSSGRSSMDIEAVMEGLRQSVSEVKVEMGKMMEQLSDAVEGQTSVTADLSELKVREASSKVEIADVANQLRGLRADFTGLGADLKSHLKQADMDAGYLKALRLENERARASLQERTRDVARLMQSMARMEADWNQKSAAFVADSKARERNDAVARAQVEAKLARAELHAKLSAHHCKALQADNAVLRGSPIVRLLARFIKALRAQDIRSEVEAIKQSGLFNQAWYLEANPDVSRQGMCPIEHYLRHGVSEGRNPSPDFDSHRYLMKNADVLDSGMNPLLHYVLHGRSERRPIQ